MDGEGISTNSFRYVCGECGMENTLKPKEPIRCSECGYRILYKTRTTNVVQYEAR